MPCVAVFLFWMSQNRNTEEGDTSYNMRGECKPDMKHEVCRPGILVRWRWMGTFCSGLVQRSGWPGISSTLLCYDAWISDFPDPFSMSQEWISKALAHLGQQGIDSPPSMTPPPLPQTILWVYSISFLRSLPWGIYNNYANKWEYDTQPDVQFE